MNKNYLDELTILMNEFSMDSLESTAAEVLHNHNSFDYSFVIFCQEFLDNSTNEEENANRSETD